MDRSDDETVYVRGQATGCGGITLHTDPDCSHLNNSNSVLKHPRGAYPDDQTICAYCAGTFDPAGSSRTGPWETLEEMDVDDLVTDGGSVQGDEEETGTQCVDDTDRCHECGRDLGAGYLCDDCDRVEGWDR